MAFIGNTNTTQAFTPAIDYFSGNGSTTAFILSRPVASVAQVQVTVNNVAQNPSSAYTVSGNTITFTSAPSSGTNNIYVYYTSPITQVIAPSQGSVNTTSLGNITNIASGNSSLTLQTGSSPTTALTIDTSQNVGIGGSPDTLLTLIPSTNTAYSLHLCGNDYGVSYGTKVYAQNKNEAGTTSSFYTTNKLVSSVNGRSNVQQWLSFVADTTAGDYQYWSTGGTERMRINSSGYVTTPYNPSFLAYRAGGNTAISSGTNTLPLDGTVYNVSSSYSTVNTRFTAPVAGTYQFNLTANVYSTPGVMQVNLYVNGTDYISGTRLSNTINGDNNITMSTALYLNVNDYVVPRIYVASNSNISSGVFWNNFSGYLVG